MPYTKRVTRVLEKNRVDTKMIHPGMTPLLQWLDSHVNKPFKDGMKDQWDNWIENVDRAFTESSKICRVSNEMIAEWANDVWKRVATDEQIIRGCEYID